MRKHATRPDCVETERLGVPDAPGARDLLPLCCAPVVARAGAPRMRGLRRPGPETAVMPMPSWSARDVSLSLRLSVMRCSSHCSDPWGRLWAWLEVLFELVAGLDSELAECFP